MNAENTAALAMIAALTLSGCASGDECRFGPECASGVCSAGGMCVPADDGGVAVDADIAVDADTSDDADIDDDAGEASDGGTGAGTDAGGATDGGPPACHDGDGRLTADEVPLPLDVAIEQRIATDVSIDTRGTERADGTRVWDFEGPFSGDADRAVVRTSPAGAWWASSFPGATHALPLSVEDDLLGVFALTRDAVRLLGIVSPDGGLLRTELTYDPPAAIWRFPLEPGAAWSEASTVSGVTNGIGSFYTERWSVEVDASGHAGTPAGVREVFRVNTRITRTVGLVVTETRRHSYVEPCVGAVAQLLSVGPASEPTTATELWRIAR